MVTSRVHDVVGIIKLNTLSWKLLTGILKNIYSVSVCSILNLLHYGPSRSLHNRLKPIRTPMSLLRIIAGVRYLAHSSSLFKSLEYFVYLTFYRHPAGNTRV